MSLEETAKGKVAGVLRTVGNALVKWGGSSAALPSWAVPLLMFLGGIGTTSGVMGALSTDTVADALPQLLDKTGLDQACLTYLDQCQDKPIPPPPPVDVDKKPEEQVTHRGDATETLAKHPIMWLPRKVHHFVQNARVRCDGDPCVVKYRVRGNKKSTVVAFADALCKRNAKRAGITLGTDSPSCGEMAADGSWSLALPEGDHTVSIKVDEADPSLFDLTVDKNDP